MSVLEIHQPNGTIYGLVVSPAGRVTKAPPPLAWAINADWNDLKKWVERRSHLGWRWYVFIGPRASKLEGLKIFDKNPITAPPPQPTVYTIKQ